MSAAGHRCKSTAGTGETLEDMSPRRLSDPEGSHGEAGTGEAEEVRPSSGGSRGGSRSSSEAPSPQVAPKGLAPLKLPGLEEACQTTAFVVHPARAGSDVVLAPAPAWQVREAPGRDDFSKLALERQLREHAIRGDVSRVEALLEAGASTNVAQRGGPGESRYVTLLHTLCGAACQPGGAAPPGCTEVAELLLSGGANVNPRCSEGFTPLMRACKSKNVAMTRLLMEYRADITAVDDMGVDPLKYALVLDPPQTPESEPAADLAAVVSLEEDEADVPTLVLPGAVGGTSPKAGPLRGTNPPPPRPATGDGAVSAQLVRILLELGPPQAVRKVLRLAEEEQRSDGTQSLAQRRKSIKQRVVTAGEGLAITKLTSLTRAAAAASTQAEELSKSESPDGSTSDLAKEPPLMTAVRMLNHQAAGVLLEVGGVQALYLHEAVRSRSVELVRTLCSGQADPSAENSQGESAMDIALELQDNQILDALRGALKTPSLAKPPLKQEGWRPSSSSSSPAHKKGRKIGPDGSRTHDLLSMSGEAGTPDDEGGGGGRGSPLARLRRCLWRLCLLLGLASLYARLEVPLRPFAAALVSRCTGICRHRYFQSYQFILLMIGLMISDLWVVMSVPGDSILDALLTAVLLGFVTELLVQAIALRKAYLTSFFFYMDIVGACSLLLDMSVFRDLVGTGSGVGENAVIMRAARAARLGARAGRFSRLVKLMRFLPGFGAAAESAGTAKVITSKLVSKLSMWVSCLIIVLAMVLPLFNIFTYPFQDWSMSMYVRQLEGRIALNGNDTAGSEVQEFITDFRAAFSDKLYYPHTCYYGPASARRLLFTSKGDVGPRSQLRIEEGYVSVVFDFGGSNQAESAANLAMIVAIVCFMVGFSLVISKSVTRIAMVPLESIMSQVREMTSTIYDQADSMYMHSMYKAKAKNDTAPAAPPQPPPAPELDEDMGDEEHIAQETALLEKVVKKIATLGEILMRHERPEDLTTLEYLGEAAPPAQRTAQASEAGNGSEGARMLDRHSACSASFEELLYHSASEEALDEDLKALESWAFDALLLDRTKSISICVKILKLMAGKVFKPSEELLQGYVEVACAGYKAPQYHNWHHAVDVTHVLFHVVHRCSRQGAFMSPLEEFALLTSAVCHDIGHPGVNNDFLVKTTNELAICYNDVSPLENMHCAKMFEIATRPRTRIFGDLTKEQYAEVRAICVAAILHTDNVHHMPMVKKLQLFGEVHSEMLEAALATYYRRCEAADDAAAPERVEEAWPTKELSETFWDRENRELMRNLVFHFADINNTTRPFKICKEWAIRVLDEFFAQGDLERQRGLPVGPLNDRDKLNRPFSQIGFIDFFAAPFVFATVRILPPLQELGDQLTSNFSTWVDAWLDEEPRAEEEVTKIQARVRNLEERNVALKVLEVKRGSFTKDLAKAERGKSKGTPQGRRPSLVPAVFVRSGSVRNNGGGGDVEKSGSGLGGGHVRGSVFAATAAHNAARTISGNAREKSGNRLGGKAGPFAKRMSFRPGTAPAP